MMKYIIIILLLPLSALCEQLGVNEKLLAYMPNYPNRCWAGYMVATEDGTANYVGVWVAAKEDPSNTYYICAFSNNNGSAKPDSVMFISSSMETHVGDTTRDSAAASFSFSNGDTLWVGAYIPSSNDGDMICYNTSGGYHQALIGDYVTNTPQVGDTNYFITTPGAWNRVLSCWINYSTGAAGETVVNNDIHSGDIHESTLH
jgi:hypothetical protein